jgi:oligoendopeptidase F
MNAALGNLPEWNLADLYDGPDAPRFAADMKKAEADAAAFAAKYKGMLAKSSGSELAEALKAYEGLSSTMSATRRTRRGRNSMAIPTPRSPRFRRCCSFSSWS